ncbi:hypothetical protein VNI00_016717 [Paramarasmius palmivorus]|uniref:Uncharacterized protein n=1 Tax=Paramarasmius palmivorus TaxID=297713 RepID=A0AAW0BEU8_9AGAR
MGASLSSRKGCLQGSSVGFLGSLIQESDLLTRSLQSYIVQLSMRYFLRSQAKFSLPPSPSPLPDHAAFEAPETLADPLFVIERVDLEQLVDSAEQEALCHANVAEDIGIHAFGTFTAPPHVEKHIPTAESQLKDANSPSGLGQSHSNKKRAEKRREKRKNCPSNDESRVLQEAIQPAVALRAEFDAKKLDASRGAYAGNKGGRKVLGAQADVEKEYDLQDLLKMGFQHEEWDGYTSKPIVVNDDLIIGVLAGQPRRPDYKRDADGVHDLLMQKGREHGLQVRGEEEDNKRGDFPARRRGYTMGMGSSQPVVLDNGVDINNLLTELVQDQRLVRLNGYQNGAFGIWAERIKARYDAAMSAMHKNIHKADSERGRNFEKSSFATVAFNFGGKVRCWKHRDQQNLPLGWCAITALGRFNPRKSARLVLWELKLVIDFPPGSTILIPSAVITHSNTRITPAGAIFRWVDAGCMTDKALKVADRDAWKAHERKKEVPVAGRLGIFSRVNEVLARAN